MVEKLHIWRKYRPEQPSDEVDAVHELTRFGGFDEQQARAIARVLDDRSQFQKNDYREAFLTIERWADRNIGDLVALPFIVVADDGSGDFTSIKDAIEATTDSPSSDVGGRFIWVKPHSTGGAYVDTGAGAVACGGRNVYVFGPSGDWGSGAVGHQAWQVEGLSWGAFGLATFEGLNIQLFSGASSRLLSGSDGRARFINCDVQSGGGSTAVVASSSAIRSAFEYCNIGLPVFRGATTWSSVLVFDHCIGGVNFSPSGGAVTITGDANIFCYASDLTWRDWAITGGSGNINGNLVFDTCTLNSGTGGSTLTVADIHKVSISNMRDNYLGNSSANTGTWTFSSASTVDRAPSINLSNNSLRYISLVFSASAGNQQSNLVVRVSGIYRTLRTGASFTVADVVLGSGQTATVLTYVTVDNACQNCNIKAAVNGLNSGATVAGSIAYNLAGSGHILTLSGFATCPTASTPVPGVGPPTTEINGTHILTITN